LVAGCFGALPRALKEGEYVVERTGDLSLLVEGAKKIYVWDSAEKNRRLRAASSAGFSGKSGVLCLPERLT
jgi:hypothetical protein